MKPVKDIENISLEELEAVSTDDRIPVPEGFRDRIGKNMLFLKELTDRRLAMRRILSQRNSPSDSSVQLQLPP